MSDKKISPSDKFLQQGIIISLVNLRWFFSSTVTLAIFAMNKKTEKILNYKLKIFSI